MKTLIIGLGNPILTDDGVGVFVARAVEAVLSGSASSYSHAYAYAREGLPEDADAEEYRVNGRRVTITEASVGGLRLMEMMAGWDQVILIDALTARDDSPGTVRRMTLADLRAISPAYGPNRSASAHDTSLITAMDTGRRMGLALPQDVVIFAVAVENITDFADRPSPAVAAAIPRVTQAVLAELNRDP